MLPASSPSSAPLQVVGGVPSGAPSGGAAPSIGQMALPFLSRRLMSVWEKTTNSRKMPLGDVTVAAAREFGSVVQVAPWGSITRAAPSPLPLCLIGSAGNRPTAPNSTGVAIRLLVAGSTLRS